ncbi:hypothetical protein IEQ44_02285 [Nocardioides sp. Y6]|uniref:DUF6752 domain-containing protein n=1 Tax=Nocardioides malaquae TaxID=2773426 RepID=A0ABR9RPH5_9ACTN|nr:DUF6752 domain-containing protein [Nocardioides malaquae]MBE7323481.1 hypothetical protein [Nocardioides malaquae]
MKKSLRQWSPRRMAQLEQRVTDLEADLAQVRRHNLRLAELTDVVQELLVPMASRDEAAIEAALERFRESL